jgi:hypothetical protein
VLCCAIKRILLERGLRNHRNKQLMHTFPHFVVSLQSIFYTLGLIFVFDVNIYRPISLTPGLSKVLEDFVVRCMLDDLNGRIDPCQFGCLKGLSTTYCLLDMLHTWLSHLDSQNKHIRICFLDFSKAFDRIGYIIFLLTNWSTWVLEDLLFHG